MQVILCGKIKRHYQKRDFSVSFFFSFLSVLGTKTLKYMESTLYRNTKQHNVSSECFGLLTYQTTKQHAKHPLWKNKITLTKMCIFSVLAYYVQRSQNAGKIIYMRNKLLLKLMFYVFLSSLGTKALNA